MNESVIKFHDSINASHCILVITHVGPDPDAFCSLLLMGTTLQANYPDKRIIMSSEEQTGDLEFLSGYSRIEIQPLSDALEKTKPDLIIIVDAMNLTRCTRLDVEPILRTIKNEGIKVAIIDHHEAVDVEQNEVYINQASPAAVQDVYEVLFDHLKLKKPDGYGQTTMLGLYADTGGFVYDNKRYKDTFRLIGDLIASGVSIEDVASRLYRYSEDTMRAFAEICKNIDHQDSYSYSYISDDFTAAWQADDKNFDDLKMAVGHFVDSYIRNIEDRNWGFVVYRDLPGGDNLYGVSMRATSGQMDVSMIANKLGGGGHKPAAGAKIKAQNVQEALAAVKSAIEQVK